MDSIRRLCRSYQHFDCLNFLLFLLIAMALYVVFTNIYFLITRHSQIWPKSICRISLYTIQNVYFIWRVWEIHIVENYWLDIFIWALVSFFPIMVSDTILELILYLKLGKDISSQSKAHIIDFAGSEQNMIGMYFQLYFCSFFMTIISEIGYVVVVILNCRNGGVRNYRDDDEIQRQIEQKITSNSIPYTLNELIEKECSICQAELAPNENIVKLHCLHIFHKQCIALWFLRISREQGQLNCPNCRADLIG